MHLPYKVQFTNDITGKKIIVGYRLARIAKSVTDEFSKYHASTKTVYLGKV